MLKTMSHAPGARRGFFVLYGHSAIRSILPNMPHKQTFIGQVDDDGTEGAPWTRETRSSRLYRYLFVSLMESPTVRGKNRIASDQAQGGMRHRSSTRSTSS